MVPHDTQPDSHLRVPYSAGLLVQPPLAGHAPADGFASPLATVVSMLLCFWFVGHSDRRLAAQFASRKA